MLKALPDGLIALAVSGGSDSMAMLHLVMQAKLSHLIVALTVDHGLRAGSRSEAEQVAQFCDGRGVDHHILKWDGEKPSTGIQAKARKARYDLMTHWCAEHGVAVLLTAHTMEDQAETVVMRKLRTSSPKSLAGIWPESVWNGIRVIRPLLQARREELRTVLRTAGVEWSEDPSNENLKFERVRVRATLEDSDVARLAAVADSAREQSENSIAAASRWLKAHANVEATGLVRLPRQKLVVCSELIAREILDKIIHMVGGGAPDPEAIEQVRARILAGGCFRTTLGGAMVAVRTAEILFGREPARIAATPVVTQGRPVLWDGRFLVMAPVGCHIVPAGPRCPKPKKTLPAFVLSGLPLVTTPGGQSVLPHFQPELGVSVDLGERFHL